MKKKNRFMFLAASLIAASFAITFVIAVFLFGWSFVQALFVPWMLLTSVFILVAFCIYRIWLARTTTNLHGQ